MIRVNSHFLLFTGSSEVVENNKEYDEFSLCELLVGFSVAFICSSFTLYKLCTFLVTMYIAGEAHPHSQ